MYGESFDLNITKDFELERTTTLLCFSHLRWDFVYQRPQQSIKSGGPQP